MVKLSLFISLTFNRNRQESFYTVLILLTAYAWGYSSVVEHSTADREVPGSNPGVPSYFSLHCQFYITRQVFAMPTF